MLNWPLVKKRVIELAVQEFELWSTADLKEHEVGATSILEKYWRSVKSAAEAKKIVEELQADPDHLLHPWSAAFISWIMKTAGATKFKKSAAHRVYLADAKYNRENSIVGNPFWAYRIDEVKPEVGDLICQRRCTSGEYQDAEKRARKCATYENIAKKDPNGKRIEWRTHCDIVTEVHPNRVSVVGGNVGQSVSQKNIQLDPNGYVKKKSQEHYQYIAIIKFRDARETINVRIQLDSTSSVLNSGAAHSERCIADNATILALEAIGSGLKHQIRIVNGDELALFTVKRRHQGLGIRIGPDGLERIAVQDPGGMSFRVDARVTRSDLSPAAAKDASELIERLTGNGSKLIVLAPHGGDIEVNTDKQAKRVHDAFESDVATCWRCMGWKDGGGAFDRWHITSTEISENSFPLLEQAFAQSYTHAVAFHGWSNDYVGIGGMAPKPRRKAIADALQTALQNAGSDIEVRLETSGGLSGGSSENIVNRITTSGKNGVQIEQPLAARKDHWDVIADAVSSVYQNIIT